MFRMRTWNVTKTLRGCWDWHLSYSLLWNNSLQRLFFTSQTLLQGLIRIPRSRHCTRNKPTVASNVSFPLKLRWRFLIPRRLLIAYWIPYHSLRDAKARRTQVLRKFWVVYRLQFSTILKPRSSTFLSFKNVFFQGRILSLRTWLFDPHRFLLEETLRLLCVFIHELVFIPFAEECRLSSVKNMLEFELSAFTFKPALLSWRRDLDQVHHSLELTAFHRIQSLLVPIIHLGLRVLVEHQRLCLTVLFLMLSFIILLIIWIINLSVRLVLFGRLEAVLSILTRDNFLCCRPLELLQGWADITHIPDILRIKSPHDRISCLYFTFNWLQNLKTLFLQRYSNPPINL